MKYGWMGKSLEIDLSQGKLDKQETDQGLTGAYLGGKGVGAKLLWDRVPPEVDPFSSENVLIFTTAPLTGTKVPTASRCSVLTRSPQTKIIGFSGFTGFWAAALKQAGYDSIILSKRAPSPAYIWIDDDTVEIRDAGSLWGKNALEVERLIKEDLKTDRVRVITIGQAGENKVSMASIQHGPAAAAARTGVGAVMGDKNVKAIAVRGTKEVNIARAPELLELRKAILDRSTSLKNLFDNISWIHGLVVPGLMEFGNGEETPPEGIEKLGAALAAFAQENRKGKISCQGCPVACRWAHPDQESVDPMIGKCEPWIAFLCKCNKFDFHFSLKASLLCNQYGLDIISTSSTVAFAIDLYQKGILTQKDTEGLHLEWGNEDVAYTLIKRIAGREGIGDLLANGVYEAARSIGRGAEEYAHHVKKLETNDYHFYSKVNALTNALSETGCLFKSSSMLPTFFLHDVAKKMFLESHMKEGFVPEEYVKYLEDNYEGKGKLFTFYEHFGNIADLLGICRFHTGIMPFPSITLSMMAELASCATGVSIDEPALLEVSERVINLIRAYNVRCGIRRKDDSLPEKFFRNAPLPHQKGEKLDDEEFDKMIDEAYEVKGWNKEGIPTQEKLEALGLGYVREDLEQRGILTG